MTDPRDLQYARLLVEDCLDVQPGLLLAQLDSDEGSRRLDELGIGCNPGITRLYLDGEIVQESGAWLI